MFETLNQQIARGYTPTIDMAEAQNNALRNMLVRQQIENYPQDQAWREEERGMQRENFKWLSEDRLKELELRPIKDETEKVKYLLTVGPLIPFKKYGQSRDWLIHKNKIPPFILPEPQAFMDKAKELGTDPEELFEKWKEAILSSTDARLREKLGMARIESAEKLGQLRAETSEKLAGARFEGLEKNQALRFQYQQQMEDLRQQHRKELEAARGEAKEGKDILSRQKEARLTIFKLYGMNEFTQYDESTSDKAAQAVSEAAQLLEQNPDLDPMTAASRAKRKVDSRFKAVEGIGTPKKQKETTQAIRNSLDGGVDTADILRALVAKGWAKEDAIAAIRAAAQE